MNLSLLSNQYWQDWQIDFGHYSNERPWTIQDGPREHLKWQGASEREPCRYTQNPFVTFISVSMCDIIERERVLYPHINPCLPSYLHYMHTCIFRVIRVWRHVIHPHLIHPSTILRRTQIRSGKKSVPVARGKRGGRDASGEWCGGWVDLQRFPKCHRFHRPSATFYWKCFRIRQLMCKKMQDYLDLVLVAAVYTHVSICAFVYVPTSAFAGYKIQAATDPQFAVNWPKCSLEFQLFLLAVIQALEGYRSTSSENKIRSR